MLLVLAGSGVEQETPCVHQGQGKDNPHAEEGRELTVREQERQDGMVADRPRCKAVLYCKF